MLSTASSIRDNHKRAPVGDFLFLFGEPGFIRSLDPDKTVKKFFRIVDEHLELAKCQKQVAKECADWIRSRVDIRSVKQSNLLHGKMYHINIGGINDAIIGSSNFTVKGLGLGQMNNIELNLEVNDRRDREDLKDWFEELWNGTILSGVVAFQEVDA
jgi:hypothetical protein